MCKKRGDRRVGAHTKTVGMETVIMVDSEVYVRKSEALFQSVFEWTLGLRPMKFSSMTGNVLGSESEGRGYS